MFHALFYIGVHSSSSSVTIKLNPALTLYFGMSEEFIGSERPRVLNILVMESSGFSLPLPATYIPSLRYRYPGPYCCYWWSVSM